MTITIEAVYEQGVLKLLQPIPLAEGTHVEVIVISTETPTHHYPLRGLPIVIAEDFDEPMPELWRALGE